MEGDAAHADRVAVGGAARGQRDAEDARRLFGVVVKQLVEVAHAVEQQHCRVVGLQAQVLLHHRRMFFARAVLDGGCVDFGGDGGHFFFIGVAPVRRAIPAFYRFRRDVRANPWMSVTC